MSHIGFIPPQQRPTASPAPRPSGATGPTWLAMARNGPRVPSLANAAGVRSTSVPSTERRRGRLEPMIPLPPAALKEFGERLRERGLPPPVETVQDPRGNRMSITSTGHINFQEDLRRGAEVEQHGQVAHVVHMRVGVQNWVEASIPPLQAGGLRNVQHEM